VNLHDGRKAGSWAMMQDITRIIRPNHLWPGLPKQ
jgi:hypothetical protein